MNKKTIAFAVVLGGCLLGSVGTGLAHGVNARQATQQERIQRGAVQGDLTRREAVSLQVQQTRIAHTEARMRHDDGVLGPFERARLDAQQDRANAAIRRQRHDAQRR